MLFSLLLPFAAAFAGTLALTPLVRAFARSVGLVAKPTADRWHVRPTALLGGIAVYGGFLVGALTALWVGGVESGGVLKVLGRPGVGIMLSSSLMFLVGLVDDKLRLRPATKLVFQGLAAGIVISFGVVYPVTPWTMVNVLVTFFWFLALTNALNLLDNMDGVAIGVAGIAALFLSVTFAMEGAWVLAAVCIALAGSALGFLPYNFHRASIFMGDSGSLFLGSLLASMGAAYPSTASASIVSVLFVPALIVIIPILDTLLVAVARTLAGRPISLGGRDHTSHRLVAMGLSERQVALLLYTFAAAGGGLAMVLRGASPAVGLSVGGVFMVGLLTFAAYLGHLHSYSPSERPSGRVTLLISDLLHKRRAFEVVLDLILFAVAYEVAYLLRWDGNPPADQSLLFERTLALVVVAKSVAFGLMGVYRGHWHQISTADAHRIAKATLLGSLLSVAALVLFFPSAGFARGVLVIDALVVMLLVTGARLSFRSLEMVRHSLHQEAVPTLIYGAGRAGEMVVREMVSNPALMLRPVGFIDDDRTKHGRLVHGYPVLGGVEDLARVVGPRGVRKIVICSRKLRPDNVDRLRGSCSELSLELLKLHLEFQVVPTVAETPAPAVVGARAEQRIGVGLVAPAAG